MGSDSLSEIVDLSRYPIDDLKSADGGRVVRHAKSDLAERGLCLLRGFIRPDALEEMVAEAIKLLPRAFSRDLEFNVYGYALDNTLPPQHPARIMNRTVQQVIGYHLMSEASKLRALYEADAIPQFLSAVLDEPVYRCADPLVSLTITALGDGHQHAWHFDSNDYVVSILLQRAEAGGEFQFVPAIRSAEDENLTEVARVLNDDSERVVTATVEPGTLALFQGEYSLHRVSPIRGPTKRLIALLSYDKRPDMVFPEDVQLMSTGLTASAVAGS